MLLVADANIVISAIIKGSVTQNLLFNPFLELYSPEFILAELEEHEEEIRQKGGFDEETFQKIFELVLSRISLVPEREYAGSLHFAEAICRDPDDIPYVALALALKCPIWTRDKRLFGLAGVQAITTKELVELFY